VQEIIVVVVAILVSVLYAALFLYMRHS